MFPERYRPLLSACVDGELSRRQLRRLKRILDRYPDAQAELQKLQENARALQQLPRHDPPHDLADTILTTIHTRRLRPSRRARLNNPPALPAWPALAAAAMVLFVVGLGSYFYFSFSLPAPEHSPQARVPQSPASSSTEGQTSSSPSAKPPVDTADDTATPPTPPAVSQQPVRTAPQTGPRAPEAGHPAVPPESAPDTIFAGALDHLQVIQISGTGLPVVFRLEDLAQAHTRQRLQLELSRDHAFRLELPCSNGTRALDRLHTVLERKKIPMLLDPKAQERRANPRIVTSYALYLDNVTAEELLPLLLEAQAEDARVRSRQPNEGQLDRLIVARLTPPDHRELIALFGADPTVPVTRSSSTLPLSPHQPLSDLTAKQVADSLKGQGGSAVTRSTPSPLTSGQTVLVAPYPASLGHGGTAQMRQFLQLRKPPRPGTLSLLLVLRTS